MKVLVEGVIGRPGGGAFRREGIDRRTVLMPYSFLAFVGSIEESIIIHVKLAGANADDRAYSRGVRKGVARTRGLGPPHRVVYAALLF